MGKKGGEDVYVFDCSRSYVLAIAQLNIQVDSVLAD